MKAYCFLTLFVMLSPGFLSGENLDEAMHLYEHGKFKQAVTLLSEMIRSSPEDPQLRFWLGKSYLKIQEWRDAVRELEKAVQIEPSNALYHLWLGRACGGRASHVIFFRAFGWARRVVKEFETARELAPENLDVRYDLLEYYLNAPGIVGGGRDKAEAEVKAISKLDPKHSHTARSIILIKDKKWDQAREELIQATVKFPNYADAYKDLANFLLDRQDYEGAAKYALEALALDSQSKQSQLILAAAETQILDDLSKTEKKLQEIVSGPLVDEGPTFEEAYYWLGQCYLAQGVREKARQAFQSALSFNPEYERAKNALSQMK